MLFYVYPNSHYLYWMVALIRSLAKFSLHMYTLSYFSDIPKVPPYIWMRNLFVSLVNFSLHMRRLSYFTDIPIALPLRYWLRGFNAYFWAIITFVCRAHLILLIFQSSLDMRMGALMLSLVKFPFHMRSSSYLPDIPIAPNICGWLPYFLKFSLHMQSLSYSTDKKIFSPIWWLGTQWQVL